MTPLLTEVQIYADEEETKEMKLCHEKSIELLNLVFDGLADFDRTRVLEVAAGDGRATEDLLVDKFISIDCFDQCLTAVKKLESLKNTYSSIKNVD